MIYFILFFYIGIKKKVDYKKRIVNNKVEKMIKDPKGARIEELEYFPL